jgi:hypothetical protein
VHDRTVETELLQKQSNLHVGLPFVGFGWLGGPRRAAAAAEAQRTRPPRSGFLSCARRQRRGGRYLPSLIRD